MQDIEAIDPRLTPAEREEKGHIAYFLGEWAALHARGLVADDAYQVIDGEHRGRLDAIDRLGRYREAMARAGNLLSLDPPAALGWAEQARQLIPDRAEAWALAIDLHRRLGALEPALTLCQEAAARFAELQPRLQQLQRERETAAAARQHSQNPELLLATMRSAFNDKRYENVVGLANRVLALEPGCEEATVNAAFAYQRLGQLGRALPLYEELHRRDPGNPAWVEWIENVRERMGSSREPAPPALAPAALAEPVDIPEVQPAPAFSWASISSEFLLDHWQKLLLCLAVLLIAVSSNIIAYRLLGAELWRPWWQCVLGFMYTTLFAGFGFGLVRWGASRAGRMMLLTTLIVIPANFMLVGQIVLLRQSVDHFALLAIESAALFLLIRGIVRSLEINDGASFLTAGLFVIGFLDGSTKRGVSVAWGFTSLLATAAIYLGFAWRLNGRRSSGTDEERRDFIYLALALLTFSFLSGEVRAGLYVIHPVRPALFAVPMMLLAIACVRSAQTLARFGPEERGAQWLRFGGFVLSALAFALALSRPPGDSPLYSGNTLGMALFGLALYAASLRAYRHPAYLYLSFAALLVAYFGAFHFVGDLIRSVESFAGRLLGYRGRLPLPFKSLNGLLLSSVLAFLAIAFSRRWNDRRLARHCHYLGLPFAVAACVFSAFEPTAGLLCLSGYAILFAVAVWVFEAPLLVYLACAALTGAVYFGSTLRPEVSVAAQALLAACIGALFWAIERVERGCGAARPYRVPLLHAAVALGTLATIGAVVGRIGAPPMAILPAITLGTVTLLLVLVDIEDPQPALIYLAAFNANFAYADLVNATGPRWSWHPPIAVHAAVASLAALFLAGLGARLQRRASQGRCRPERSAPVCLVALIEVAIGLFLGLSQLYGPEGLAAPGTLVAIGLGFALTAAALATLTASAYRTQPMAHATVLAGTMAVVVWSLGALSRAHVALLPASLAVALGFISIALYVLWKVFEFTGRTGTYREPLVYAALLVLGLSWLCCAGSGLQYWPAVAPLRLDWLAAATLTLSAVSLAALTRETARVALAHLAIACWFGVWLCAFQIASGGALFVGPSHNFVMVVLTFALAMLAAGEAATAHAWRSGVDDSAFGPLSVIRTALFAVALPDFATVATGLGLGLMLTVRLSGGEVVVSFLLASAAFLWLTRFRRQLILAYLGIGHASAAAFAFSAWQVGWSDPGVGLGWFALTASVSAVVLWAIGAAVRGKKAPGFFSAPCLNTGAVLGLAALGLGLAARGASVTAFPVSLAALLVDVVAGILLAVVWRAPAATVGAIVSLVAATYVTLFSIGESDPSKAYVLGFVAVVEATLLWVVGTVCRKLLRAEWDGVFARPVLGASVVLTMLAVPPSYSHAPTMALVALGFVLAIQSFPSPMWLYPALLALEAAGYDAWFRGGSHEYRLAGLVGSAYVIWAWGILAERYGPKVCERLRLGTRALSFPFFNMAVAASVLAAWLRILETVNGTLPWTAEAALPLALALFCLLMLRPYPHRVWAHASIALATLAFTMFAAPRIVSPLDGLVAGMGLAHGWYLVMRGAASIESRVCGRMGIANAHHAAAAGPWSLALFIGAIALTIGLVVQTTILSVFGIGVPIDVAALGGWDAPLITLVLAGLYVCVAVPRLAREQTLMSLALIVTLTVWWLGAPASPLLRALQLDPAVYFPMATALLGFASVALGLRFGAEAERLALGPLGVIDDRGMRRLDQFAWQFGAGLALISSVFTLGTVSYTTATTLMLVALAFAVVVVARGEPLAGLAGSLATCAGLVLLALCAARGEAIDHAEQLVWGAIGGTAAAFGLWGAAGGLRRIDGRTLAARVVESVALAASAGVCLAIVASRLEAGPTDGRATMLGVGVLLLMVLFDIVLAHRWRAEWLVYLAQATLLGAYFSYRLAFPLTPAAEAAILTLIGYLDLGIAEVMERLKLRLYARPTAYFSLVMPLIPLVLEVRQMRIDEVHLFLVFASATFYGVACYKLQWRSLGYAAAVLYNAFLWILWSQVGFKMVDQPQFFLIPVGLSAILFAEVNRQELGQQAVAAIRAVGLMTIYASLALPIWQTESLGAWLTLMLASLAAILTGIALRVRLFLWLGLVCFVLNVVYELGRRGMHDEFARWAIMLALGVALVLFVALNEKTGLVASMKDYLKEVRHWE
jgi:tetratricopeptide (TPR) repeat protein